MKLKKVMTKTAILRRKMIRCYNKTENREYSISKGYPEDTYFGFSNIEELVSEMTKRYVGFYGKGLRHSWF